MPKRSAIPEATATFSTTPEAKEFVLANYRDKSLMDLATLTGVGYGSISEFLRKSGLYANRYSRKRRNLRPILSMSDLELAYLAGIIDGEGTITITDKGNGYLTPYILVTNTSSLLHNWLTERNFSSTVRKNVLGRRYFHLSIGGWEIEEPLKLLLPYFVIKKLHALCLLRIMAIRKSLPFRGPMPEEVWSLVAEIKELNQRGFRFEKDQEDASRYSILSQKLASSLQMAL
jgi:hypothetical protein